VRDRVEQSRFQGVAPAGDLGAGRLPGQTLATQGEPPLVGRRPKEGGATSIGQPPVPFLSAAAATETSITLEWTNPVNTGFAGVTIRRSLGAVPPATPTAGVSVPVPDSPTEVSFTDTGLTANTVYSYAVFARDEGGLPEADVAKIMGGNMYELMGV